jgi:hypothetical protein
MAQDVQLVKSKLNRIQAKAVSYDCFPSLIKENQNATSGKPEILELLY